ncbi:MAG: hypothetical protein H7Z41_06680 [Cytophagales bacterium]|nr:hypothetical protein [Armatimonadota bacterium]
MQRSEPSPATNQAIPFASVASAVPTTEKPTVHGGVSARAVLIGLLFAVFFCAVTPYNDFKIGATFIAGNQFPIGAMFVLFFFAFFVNGVLRKTVPAKAFRSSELLTIWTLILVASGLPSSGLMRYLIPNIAAPQYLSNATNNWEQKVWGGTPPWLRLSDAEAATAYISGYPLGQEQVPWGAWAVPLFFWGLLVLFFITASFCFANLLRRQWVENEKFSFPLVTLPVLIAEEPKPGRVLNDLLRSPMLWTGVLLVTVLHGVKGLHLLYPSIPDITTDLNLGQYLTSPPWNAVGGLPAKLYPLVIGLAYLLPSEVCFSLWFFYLFFKGQLVVAGIYNWETPGPITAYTSKQFHALEAFGGGLALLAWTCWTGRRHFRNVWEKAIGGPLASTIDDSKEMFSYRATIIGLAVSYFGIGAWLYAAGVPIAYALMSLLMVTLAFTVISWVVAQAGLLFDQQPYGTLEILAPLFGTASFKIGPLYTVTQFENVLIYDTREMMTASVLMGAKTADSAAYDPRLLFRAMCVSVGLGVVVAAATSIALPYYSGGGDSLKDGWGMRNAPSRAISFLAGASALPYQGSIGNALHIFAGLGGVLLMLLARARMNLGLHPIGFLIASTYPMNVLWFSTFLGWLFKTIIQRYGGMKGFQGALPLFLGLILGDVINAVLWIVLGYATNVGYSVMPS